MCKTKVEQDFITKNEQNKVMTKKCTQNWCFINEK
jgi:hypothetical protein